MAWDESLGMERQSSDKMVAQDSGVAAIAPEPLPPTAVTFQYPRRDTGSGHCSVSLSLEGPLSQARGARAEVHPHT